MKLTELLESSVHYTTQPNKRFRVKGKMSFSELKNHPDVVKKSGPNTSVIDVTNEDRVKKAPGENKWNAMNALYGRDDDEVVCASTGDDWVCLAVGVKI